MESHESPQSGSPAKPCTGCDDYEQKLNRLGLFLREEFLGEQHLHIESEFASRCRQLLQEETERQKRELEESIKQQYADLLQKADLFRLASNALAHEQRADPQTGLPKPCSLTYQKIAELMKDHEDAPLNDLACPHHSSFFSYDPAEDFELEEYERFDLTDIHIDDDDGDELVEDRLRQLLNHSIKLKAGQQPTSPVPGDLLRHGPVPGYDYAGPGDKALAAFRAVVKPPCEAVCTLILRDLSTAQILKNGSLYLGRNMQTFALPKLQSRVDWTFLLELRADLLLVTGFVAADPSNTFLLLKTAQSISEVARLSIPCSEQFGSLW